MPFLSQIQDATPYHPFGMFAGLPFWPGGLTLVAAAPGVGKTSWVLHILAEAARQGHPAAFLCYEHSPEELRYRLRAQAAGLVFGPHPTGEETTGKGIQAIEERLAESARLYLHHPNDRTDTPERLERLLLDELSAMARRPVLVGVDYLQRVPFVDFSGRILTAAQGRDGAVAAAFKRMALENGWHILLIAALEKNRFTAKSLAEALRVNPAAALGALLGDERVVYEADRVFVLFREGTHPCGCCYDWRLIVAKNRIGPLQNLYLSFWGQRFLPAEMGWMGHDNVAELVDASAS